MDRDLVLIDPGPRISCDRQRIPQLIEIVSGKRVALPPEGTRCEGALHEHHWITRRDGGPNTRENLVPLCEKHHRMVHRILEIYGRAELEPARVDDQERWGMITTPSKVRVLYVRGPGADVPLPTDVCRSALAVGVRQDEYYDLTSRYDELQKLGRAFNIVFSERRPVGIPAWTIVVPEAPPR